jgi:hypothetical protein
MPRSRLSPFLSVLLVFLSGAAIGALVHRLYVVKTVSTAPPAPPNKKNGPEDFRKHLVARMREALKMDDQQVDQLQKALDEERDEFLRIKQQFDTAVEPIKRKADEQRDALHDNRVAKVKSFLRPDQLPLYDKWLADRAADRKRHQQQQQNTIKQQ